MDQEQIKALIEAIKNKDGDAALQIAEAMLVTAASGGSEPPPADVSDPLAVPADPSPEDQALETALTTLTGADGPAERLTFLNKLIEDREKQAKRAADLELTSRFELVGELVKLNVEFPATAFEGDPKDRKLVSRLLVEPIADMRARVATHKAARGGPNLPPARGGDVITLSAVDQAAAKKRGLTAEQFIAAKKNAVKRS
jgi:hypothetical protein